MSCRATSEYSFSRIPILRRMQNTILSAVLRLIGRWAIAAVLLSIGMLSSLIPAVAKNSTTLDQLFCNNQVMVYTLDTTMARVTKASLDGRRFTAWVEIKVPREVLHREPHFSLSSDWGWGYEIDNSGIVELHYLMSSTDLVTALTFFGLSNGQHRFKLGMVSPEGKLAFENAYCFSVPGQLSWKPWAAPK